MTCNTPTMEKWTRPAPPGPGTEVIAIDEAAEEVGLCSPPDRPSPPDAGGEATVDEDEGESEEEESEGEESEKKEAEKGKVLWTTDEGGPKIKLEAEQLKKIIPSKFANKMGFHRHKVIATVCGGNMQDTFPKGVLGKGKYLDGKRYVTVNLDWNPGAPNGWIYAKNWLGENGFLSHLDREFRFTVDEDGKEVEPVQRTFHLFSARHSKPPLWDYAGVYRMIKDEFESHGSASRTARGEKSKDEVANALIAYVRQRRRCGDAELSSFALAQPSTRAARSSTAPIGPRLTTDPGSRASARNPAPATRRSACPAATSLTTTAPTTGE